MNKKIILECSFDEEDGSYQFRVPEGQSAEEVLFCISAFIKCIDRDGIIPKDVSLDLLNKYMTDPQYEELKQKEVN